MADITGYLDIIRSATSGESVRDAIINCMNDINKDAAVQITTKAISGKLSNINKTYKAPTGYAWSQVSLSIEDDDNPGEDRIVNNIISDEITIDDQTPNGDYSPETDHVYSVVHVNVTREWPDIADNITISIDDLDEMSGYSAVNYGYTAMKRITFTGANIAAATGGTVGPGGVVYYPVTFVDSDGKHIETVQVATGGTAFCSKQPETNTEGQTFKGWNPPSTKITKQTTCVAQYGDNIIDINELTDTWEQICAKKGKGYPLGSFKSIESTIYRSYESDRLVFPKITQTGTYKYHFVCYMYKVAEGEGGTNSTWLSSIPTVSINDGTITNKIVPSHIYANTEDKHYGQSNYLRWINTRFSLSFPDSINKAIEPVNKYYRYRDSGTYASTIVFINKQILSTLWLPSVIELYNDDIPGTFTDASGDYFNKQYIDGAIVDKNASYMKNLNINSFADMENLFKKLYSSLNSYELSLRDENRGPYGSLFEERCAMLSKQAGSSGFGGLYGNTFSSSFENASIFGFCL